MARILGTIASSFAEVASSFESIATVTVSSGSSNTVEFTSIPDTYTHLQIRGIFRSTYNESLDAASIKFNDDSGTNYASHYLNGDSSSPDAYGEFNIDPGYPAYVFFGGAATAPSGTHGGGICDILDYANVNKYKTVRSLTGAETNSSGRVYIQSVLWRSTSAITKITLQPFNGSFVQHSTFALYGIKGI